MFGSLFDLTKNVVSVVTTPIEIAVEVVNAGVKPIKEALEEIKDDVRDWSK